MAVRVMPNAWWRLGSIIQPRKLGSATILVSQKRDATRYKNRPPVLHEDWCTDSRPAPVVNAVFLNGTSVVQKPNLDTATSFQDSADCSLVPYKKSKLDHWYYLGDVYMLDCLKDTNWQKRGKEPERKEARKQTKERQETKRREARNLTEKRQGTWQKTGNEPDRKEENMTKGRQEQKGGKEADRREA